MSLKSIVAALALLLISSTASYLFFTSLKSSELPVPPDDYYITRLPEDFRCEPLEVKGSMPIRTTPEGLSLRGGLGVQLLCRYNPPEKVLVYLAFMKLPDRETARRVAEDIVKYVNTSREKYNVWSYRLGSDEGRAYFDYPGLRWEMWYRGRWIVEVGVGKSGQPGAEIIKRVKECISRLGRP